MDWSERRIYISGGTSGIGLALGVAFAARGADVFAFSVDDEARRATAVAAIRAAGRGPGQRAEAAHLDVTDPAACERVLGEAAERWGAPDVLINSAGIGGAVYFGELSYERFDATVKTSLYGARNTIAAVFPYMKKAGGTIVNVSSMSGLIGLIGYAAYASAKFGMVGMSDALRSEFKQYGIHVASLCPPQVDTPLWREANRTKPPEVVAVNQNSGLMTAAQVAEATIRGIEKRQALILPGWRAQALYHFNRLLPRWRERMTDRLIRRVQSGEVKPRIPS